ncbi:HNH endonuclease [Prochlorococcus sp. MIT 1307]|uniref:HNH endonuclease n=1 Tax=Prochlorococcus sp. MIT 1307 TaxID=3096219 RepID=UPI002A75A17D|nr:HNH endonuclease [Prochlorococcus sp. MIT 1307]
MGQVLVLNASYEPLNITTWRRATVLMLKGKAETLEEDSSHKLRHDTLLPTVIRLRHFVRVPYRELPLTRKNIIQRDNNCCQYCGSFNEKLSIDHVLPRSRGGRDEWSNVTTACLTCNVMKGNRTPQEAGMTLKKIPFKPLSNMSFEAKKQINSGRYKEWSKYVIGWS